MLEKEEFLGLCLSFACTSHYFAVLLELQWSFSCVREHIFPVRYISDYVPWKHGLLLKSILVSFVLFNIRRGRMSFLFCMNELSNFSAKETVILTAVWFLSYYANRNNEVYICLFTIFLPVFLCIFNYHGSPRVYTLRSHLGMNRTTPILKKTSRSKAAYVSISKRNQQYFWCLPQDVFYTTMTFKHDSDKWEAWV